MSKYLHKPRPQIICGCGRKATCLQSCFSKKYYVWCNRCQHEDCFEEDPLDAAISYAEMYGGIVFARENKGSEWKQILKVKK